MTPVVVVVFLGNCKSDTCLDIYFVYQLKISKGKHTLENIDKKGNILVCASDLWRECVFELRMYIKR